MKRPKTLLVTIDRFDHPITRRLDQRIDFGDSFVYGPLLVPQEHPEVIRLGGIQWPTARDGAGLVIREFGRGADGNGRPGPRGVGDYATIFSAAVPLAYLVRYEPATYGAQFAREWLLTAQYQDYCARSINNLYPRMGDMSPADKQRAAIKDPS